MAKPGRGILHRDWSKVKEYKIIKVCIICSKKFQAKSIAKRVCRNCDIRVSKKDKEEYSKNVIKPN